jgi:transcriptional regulator with XRE-family HTH domain
MKEQRYATTNFWKVLKRQGRSIRWLASETGVSENYISQMKAGRRAIRETFALRASHALSLPMDLLFAPIELHDVDVLSASSDERAAD